ncbi:hypothetical protein PoB_000114600 [Plakobranchus ocellatus]|uniref:Uncharacterized protein n=1 Tax=Plakobranchus ocellatus TaxID=259542 RepID=A0AAV3XV10_9GAST|nr:hypothetical protein PoB_000114600 [Plakobranchus ocellatus]
MRFFAKLRRIVDLNSQVQNLINSVESSEYKIALSPHHQSANGTIIADCKEAMEQVRRQELSNPRLQHHFIGKHQAFTSTAANGKKAQKPTASSEGTV